PEWGALLSNIRYQARAYPWTGFYTMAAFFIAIFAFNLFGEGVRRAVESGHLVVSRFINRYTVTVVLAGILFFNWFSNNSGATPFYREQAQLFDGQRAMVQVEALTDETFDGRSLGTDGQMAAAAYIAEQMEASGLQSGGEGGTMFQNRKHSFGRLEGEPSLTIEDGGETLVFGEDYAAYPGRFISSGEASGTVRVVGLGERVQRNQLGLFGSYIELDRVDFADDTLLVLDDEAAAILSSRVEKDGLLVVTDDPQKLAKKYTLSGRSGRPLNIFTGEVSGEESPSIWITEETADRLLAGSGFSVAELRKDFEELAPEELWHQELPVAVSMNVPGVIEEGWPVQHVIGYRPGEFGYENCQDCLDTELIVVMAQYDTPPPGPNGEVFDGANDNASGVAVMLEAARVINEADYQPRRSYLFIAYSGEGLDGGEPVSDPDIKRFLQAKTGFASHFEPVAIVQLRGLGAGSGERLEVSSSGSLRLADLFESAARQMGARPLRTEEEIDISLIYDEVNPTQDSSGQQAPVVRLFWEGWEQNSLTSEDKVNGIAQEKIEQAGRALAMALMALGREVSY
ncbi:MAG: M28 family peptidase, partial [Candidatus Promineifilaceae bacterium]|nr:M28 family peptidase [Candidatus Promineifilaceae bacterium]